MRPITPARCSINLKPECCNIHAGPVKVITSMSSSSPPLPRPHSPLPPLFLSHTEPVGRKGVEYGGREGGSALFLFFFSGCACALCLVCFLSFLFWCGLSRPVDSLPGRARSLCACACVCPLRSSRIGYSTVQGTRYLYGTAFVRCRSPSSVEPLLLLLLGSPSLTPHPHRQGHPPLRRSSPSSRPSFFNSSSLIQYIHLFARLNPSLFPDCLEYPHFLL